MSAFVQKIDLLAKLEPPKKQPVALISMAAAWLLLLTGYAVFAGVLLFQENSIHASVEAEKKQQLGVQSKIDQKLAEDGAVDISQSEARLAELRARYVKSQRLAQHLSQLSAHGDGRFSEAMIGFARQHVSGVSLQKFNLGNQYQTVSLHGRLGDPKALPQYVSNLGKESVFQRMTFEKVQVKTQGGEMYFDLFSSVLAQEDSGS